MAFIRNFEKKGLSLPGLIDIIFLLLIFSLVTLSVSQSKVETKRHGEDVILFDLPETQSRETEDVEEVLQTLMYQIEHVDGEDVNSPMILYVLVPSVSDSVTIQGAKQKAIEDSLFAVYPVNFSHLEDLEFNRLDPSRLISESLREYKEAYFLRPDLSNAIEIRAVKDTQFRIINFIMEQTSAYGDTIPRLTLRTLTGKEI